MTCIGTPARLTVEDLLVHEAAHAAVAWEVGVRVGRILVNRERREGHVAFVSDVLIGRYAPGTPAARAAAEREMLACHAGFMAQRRFHYDSTHHRYAVKDYLWIFRIAEQIEEDRAVIDAWSAYIEDRARATIEQPATWARILALAIELARRSDEDGTTEVDGATVDDFLATVRVPKADPFLAYRRREATGKLVRLEREPVRQLLKRDIERAYLRRRGRWM